MNFGHPIIIFLIPTHLMLFHYSVKYYRSFINELLKYNTTIDQRCGT